MKIKDRLTKFLGLGLILFTLDMVTLETKAQERPSAKAIAIKIPFEPSRFDTTNAKVEFLNYKGFKAMKITPGAKKQVSPRDLTQVALKNFNFINGTIEFDTYPTEGSDYDMISVFFRQQNINNAELVYLRPDDDETRQRNDAIQYAPLVHSINLWNIMGNYQGPAVIYNHQWNHIKLVVSGVQMLVYVNNMKKITLSIPKLAGKTDAGTIAFDGAALFANLLIKPNDTEGLSPNPGFDFTDLDVHYLRKWQVTIPKLLMLGQEPTKHDLPNDTTTWETLTAENFGLINLTNKFEPADFYPVYKNVRYVWLKTNIHSNKAQTVKLQLGFSNDVYVYINKGLLYLDKNTYGSPIMKYPGGRLDIANTSFMVPLKEGDNELLIAVSNNFYGWGIVARLADMHGVSIQQ